MSWITLSGLVVRPLLRHLPWARRWRRPRKLRAMTYKEQRTRHQGRRRCRPRHFWIASLAWGVISSTVGVRITNAADATGKAWIEQSNRYTRQLFDVQLKHSPEQGSTEGIARLDPEISDPRLADELVRQRELEKVLNALRTARAQVSVKSVQEDLDILHRA